MFPLRFPGLATAIAAAVLMPLLLLGAGQGGVGQSLRAGTEVFAVDPDLVLEVSYRTSTMRLTAHRQGRGEPFQLTFWENNQPQPSSCPAGEVFARVLAQLTSLKLRRTLEAREAEEYFRKYPLSSWAELVIRDTSTLEPFRALLKPLAGSAPEALLHFQGATYVVDFQTQVFRLLAGGCQVLGVEGAPQTK